MSPEEKLGAISGVQAFAERMEEIINEKTGWGKNELMDRVSVIQKDLFARIKRGEEI